MSAALISALSDLLTAIISVASLTITIFLWRTTSKSLNETKKQLEQHIASVKLSSQHSILDAHRELYLAIAQSDDLLRCLKDDDPNDVRGQILASLMINQAFRIFETSQGLDANPEELDFFRRDFAALMKYRFVRERWDLVKEYHPIGFRAFVNEQILQRL
jgi:hypothetical protein